MASDTRRTGSRVEEVKVFLSGAEITRRMSAEVVKGKNVMVFEDLPTSINADSINATVEKGGELVSAVFQIDNLKEQAESKDIAYLRKRLKDVNNKIKLVDYRLKGYRAEEKFLDSNRTVGGEKGSKIGDLKEMEVYHRERRMEISEYRFNTENELERLEEERERISRELGALANDKIRPAGRITVELNAENDGAAEITVTYLAGSAYWRPRHEIRITDPDSPAKLTMKGDIVQMTGEDWKEVVVTLSTGNPNVDNSKPVLRPWYVDIVTPQLHRQRLGVNHEAVEHVKMDEAMPMAASAYAPIIEETQTSVEFKLSVPTDIPSNNKETTVDLAHHTLDAEFQYYCVSKLDTDVFLLAKIKGWESMNLLAGEVSIFQGNTYAGKTYLDPAVAEDVMDISLGRDRSLMVTRERGKNLTNKGIIGKNKKVTREWIMTVRNTKSKSVKVRLVDQLPISANSAINVEALEVSGAETDKETGELSWALDIPAGGSVTKTVRYEVSYPKNATVILD